MKSYMIYHQPQRNEWQAVAQGWSWPAFFLGPIWAMVKELNGLAGGTLLGMVALGAILAAEHGPFSGVIFMISSVVIPCAFGAKFNGMQMEALSNLGFKQVAVIRAANADAAIGVHLTNVGRRA